MSKKYSGSKTANKLSKKIKTALNKTLPTKANAVNNAITMVNRKVDKLKRTVKTNLELRYEDFFNSGTVSTVGTFILLNGLTFGDDNGYREGTSIMMRSIRIRMNILCADTTQLVRVMLVMDKQANGSQYTMNDLLNTGTTSVPPTLAFINDSNKSRFTVLYDKTFNLVLNTDSDQKMIRINKFLNARTDYYEGNANNVLSISRNSLTLFLVSDSNATTHPAVNISTRLRYAA